jgi:hypothetical protein
MKYRHGDVLLTSKQIPKSAKRKQTKIVAEGEVTGHAHRLENGTIYEDGEQLYVRARKGAALTHEEHLREEIAQDEYQVTIQREYDDEKEWRQVAD